MKDLFHSGELIQTSHGGKFCSVNDRTSLVVIF